MFVEETDPDNYGHSFVLSNRVSGGVKLFKL